jgi:hypothetical protein
VLNCEFPDLSLFLCFLYFCILFLTRGVVFPELHDQINLSSSFNIISQQNRFKK